MNTEVNGQKQQPAPPGQESPAGSPVVASEALVAMVSDLLATSERAAQIVGEGGELDAEALAESVSQLTELVERLRSEIDQRGVEREVKPPARAFPQVDRRALLILLNMASNGASRSEAANYLAENLDLRDCDELLGAVYSYVDSTRADPRETKPQSERNGATPGH